MSAFMLMLPIFLIRFGFLGWLNKAALGRAAFFAPLQGIEKTAYQIYQISNIFIILFPLFLKIDTNAPFFYAALCVYILGVLLLLFSAASFAKPAASGINTNGMYKFTRNPMYVSYFIYFLGVVLLTGSWILGAAVLVFIISSHFIILSEERWCVQQFGEEYTNYMAKVRRYI